jgi:hypothetical protein
MSSNPETKNLNELAMKLLAISGGPFSHEKVLPDMIVLLRDFMENAIANYSVPASEPTALDKIADLLERSIIRGGPYDGHLMVVSKTFHENIEERPVVDTTAPAVLPTVLVDAPQALYVPQGHECFEVITTWRKGGLPRNTEVFETEEHALAAMKKKVGNRDIHIELQRVIRVTVATHTA